MKLALYVDGASSGNPGPAGIGVRILDDAGIVLWERSASIGQATNNEAEYQALIRGLEDARERHPTCEKIIVYSESQLVVQQVNGRWKVKSSDLLRLCNAARCLLWIEGRSADLVWIPRDQNTEAERLAQAGIRMGTDGAL
jgi:ribonuclease HI